MTKIRFNRSSRLLTAAAFASLFLSQAAWANGKRGDAEGSHRGRGPGAHFFDRADADKNGKIEKAEAQKMAQEHFARVDANEDGVITKEEAQKMAENFRRHHDEKGARGEKGSHLEAHFARADKNKNGKIEKSESRLPAEIFDKVDTNKDGTLTREEMRAAFQNMKKEGGQKMFAAMDANGDGKISRSEALAKSEERFAKMDQNHDGVVTREEARAAAPHFHRGHRKGGAKGQDKK